MRLHCNIFAAVLLSALAVGCTNPFSTREPEPPDSGSLPFIPARTPEIVLQNLRNAILDQNVGNYARSLSAVEEGERRFRYLPDPAIASENPGLFEDWHLDRERNWFSQLRALLPSDSLHFLSLRSVQSQQTADSAIFIEDYELTVRHTQQNQGIPAVYAGQATFWLSVDAFGDWAIHRWEDRPVDQEPSWTRLKATYGQ